MIGIGEAHAQKGSEGVDSATKRFSEQLLPALQGRARDLLIELWVAAGNCGEAEKKVQKQQAPVTANQAAGNQQEFIALGHRAKALGMKPHALVPTCEEYRSIAAAGPDDIDRMLQMIAEGTTRQVDALLARPAPPPKTGDILVLYGGSLHNDVSPPPGREHWSFGPALLTRTSGAYVELDLIVPEYIKETPAWQSLAWYSAYRRLSGVDGSTLLLRPAANAYVLIFPRSRAEAAARQSENVSKGAPSSAPHRGSSPRRVSPALSQ